MKQIRIIGLSLLALFALGAFVASSASAVEGVLPLKTLHFNILSLGALQLLETTNKEKIDCKELKGSGEFEAGEKKDHHGIVNLDFLACLALGFIAFGLGEQIPEKETEALILVQKALFLICLIEPKKLVFGIFIELKEPVHIEIPAVKSLVLVTGSVIGEILTVKGTLFVVDFNQKVGVPTVKECKDENGGAKKAKLNSKLNAGAETEAGEETKVLIQFLEEMELMDK